MVSNYIYRFILIPLREWDDPTYVPSYFVFFLSFLLACLLLNLSPVTLRMEIHVDVHALKINLQ